MADFTNLNVHHYREIEGLEKLDYFERDRTTAMREAL
jgi:hypothetical protein